MNYTSIEQSKKLIELGLSRDTADMCYYYNFKTETNSDTPAVVIGNLHDTTLRNIPIWSVGALLEVMPKQIKYKGYNYMLLYGLLKKDHYFVFYENGMYADENGETRLRLKFGSKAIDYTYNAFGKTGVEACIDMIKLLIKNKYIKKK